MLSERLGVEPHETRHTHVLEEGHLVIIRHVFLIDIVFAVLAKEMGKVTLSFMACRGSTGNLFPGEG